MKRKSFCALAILAAASSAMAISPGPTSTLYITNYNEFSPNTGVDALMGNTLFSFDTGYVIDINIAVYGDVRTMGYTPGDVGAKFSLTGIPLVGGPYTNSLAGSQLHDGTSDGNYNYTIDFVSGDVVRYSRNWTSPTAIFNVSGTLLDAGYITMNVSDGSFWLSQWGGGDLVNHYDASGNLLGGWNSGLSPAYASFGLALDPVDGTLWMADNNYNLYQFNQSGTLLQTYTGLAGTGQPYGMEFDTSLGVPEPASIGVLAIGAAALLARRRR